MTPQQIEAMKLALEALETELSIDWTNNDEFNASAEKMYEAITAIKEALADHAMQEVQRLGQEIEQEPVVYQCPRCATSMQVDLTAKAALAQPEQEPVSDDIASILACRNMLDAQPVLRRAFEAQSSIESIKYWANAYSNPESGPHFHGHGMVSRLLTEYANLVEALAQPEQEPVAWMDADGNVSDNNDHKCFPIPLYTQPPQRTEQEPVAMRMPKVGDEVVCIEDNSLGTVEYLTAGGSPEIKFDDCSHGTYLLREFAELFRYATPPQRKPLTDKAITQVIDLMPKKMKGFMVDWDLYEFARAIEAAHGIKENT